MASGAPRGVRGIGTITECRGCQRALGCRGALVEAGGLEAQPH